MMIAMKMMEYVNFWNVHYHYHTPWKIGDTFRMIGDISSKISDTSWMMVIYPEKSRIVSF